jgi:hypothetical protein
MANISVNEIQSRLAAYADQDENTSNISSTDYSLRLKYINMALTEWQEAYDWQSLYTEYNVLISTSTGNASVALPTNFRKLASYPVITNSGSTDLYPETRPQEAGQYGSTDKRVEILGNPQDNYTLRIYGTTLSSGASVKVPYYMSAQSLVSPANIAEIPNPDYLVKRSLAYLLEAREDARFPQMKQEAERILGSMIDYENVFSEASTFNTVKTVEETSYGMRWGE